MNIERVRQLLQECKMLLQQENTKHFVEQVDLADVESDLENALEKLGALQTYRCNETQELEWEERKKELARYKRDRDAWLVCSYLQSAFAAQNVKG